jgi:hypothetical protein
MKVIFEVKTVGIGSEPQTTIEGEDSAESDRSTDHACFIKKQRPRSSGKLCQAEQRRLNINVRDSSRDSLFGHAARKNPSLFPVF